MPLHAKSKVPTGAEKRTVVAHDHPPLPIPANTLAAVTTRKSNGTHLSKSTVSLPLSPGVSLFPHTHISIARLARRKHSNPHHRIDKVRSTPIKRRCDGEARTVWHFTVSCLRCCCCVDDII